MSHPLCLCAFVVDMLFMNAVVKLLFTNAGGPLIRVSRVVVALLTMSIVACQDASTAASTSVSTARRPGAPSAVTVLEAGSAGSTLGTRVGGTFRGFYEWGSEDSGFTLCDDGAPGVAGLDHERWTLNQGISLVDVFMPMRASVRSLPDWTLLTRASDNSVNRTQVAYVEWRGTIFGPGHFGHLRVASYAIDVERVSDARPPRITDCPRVNRYARSVSVAFDTTGVLAAAWRTVTARHSGERPVALTVSDVFDIGSVPISRRVIRDLSQLGIHITTPARRLALSDTAVVVVDAMDVSTDGVLRVILNSSWTEREQGSPFEVFASASDTVRIPLPRR